MIDFLMPQLGESIAEATVTQWLVREGDMVKTDESLVEVSTDKATTALMSPTSGRVVSIAAAPGQVVPKGGLLARIDDSM